MATSGVARLATGVAVAILLLNTLLFGVAGVTLRRTSLVVSAGACAIVAAAVLVAWRRHRRVLAELDGDRAALRDEARSLRELVRNSRR